MDQRIDDGAFEPPRCSGRSTLQKPESIRSAKDFLKLSGMATVLVSGSYFGGLRSASTNESAKVPSDISLTWLRISLTVATSSSSYGP